MRSFRYLFSICLSICSFTVSYAQVFKGKVVDENRLAIPGVYVHNITQNVHAHSDVNGNFELYGTQVSDSVDVSILGFGTVSFYVIDLTEERLVILKEKSFLIDEIVISGRNDAVQQISNIDLRRTPVESSQEILRSVPGLFVAQHAGGGKAEQIFLRGFDIDHGTDIAISVDGLPVNMVSHAHGQGYSDLHFVIPETIEQIEYNKGPYYSEVGNFNTAGYIDFKLKKELKYNEIGLDVGEFGYKRLLAMMNLVDKKNENLYVAAEYQLSDGPFISSQNFNRRNVLSRYSTSLRDNSEISITASHFSSEWDASGQIPERAVQSGLITRFGAIDDTEGGNTSRTNVSLSYNKNIDNNNFITNQIFYSHYDFELYSNFTFFLNNPVLGDRILQKEDRNLFGFKSAFHHSFNLIGKPSLFTLSLGMRNDQVRDVELSNVDYRGAQGTPRRLGDIDELNTYAAAEFEWKVNDFTFAPSVRFDNFRYSYKDALVSAYNPLTDDALSINPKMYILYSPTDKLQLYAKVGRGFHSNDARIALQTNTSSGFAPSAIGADLGMYFKPTKQIWTNIAFWYLNSEQEFVYVGDEGVVEPSGESLRKGFDLSIRYQPLDKLYFYTDITYSNARLVDEEEGQDFIALAPRWTGVLGANLTLDRLNIGLNSRYLGDRAANENNSVIAEGYLIADANISFEHQQFLIGLSVDNVFNSDWNETQFLTESRLQNELTPVEEIHFTPGIPRFFKTRVRYKF